MTDIDGHEKKKENTGFLFSGIPPIRKIEAAFYLTNI